MRRVSCGPVVLLLACWATSAPGEEKVPPGAACPAGYRTVTFIQLFRCSPEASAALFTDGQGMRVERRRSEHFDPSAWHATLARLARARPADFDPGPALSDYADSLGLSAFLTGSGEGVMLRTVQLPRAVGTTVCRVDGGMARGRLAARALDRHEVMILRLELDGVPHAAVLRSVAVPREAVVKEKEAFRRGLMRLRPRRPGVVMAVARRPADAGDCGGLAAAMATDPPN